MSSRKSAAKPPPGRIVVRDAFADYFRPFEDVPLHHYNIIGNNEGSLSDLTRLDPVTLGAALHTAGLLQREKSDAKSMRCFFAGQTMESVNVQIRSLMLLQLIRQARQNE